VIAFYKATAYWKDPKIKPRAFDETDFVALVPLLAPERRAWLRDAIAARFADHPWLAHLPAS
jgi:hypothetical protein